MVMVASLKKTEPGANTSKITIAPRITMETHKYLSHVFDNSNNGAAFVLETFKAIHRDEINELNRILSTRFDEQNIIDIIDLMSMAQVNTHDAGNILIREAEEAKMLTANAGPILSLLDNLAGLSRFQLAMIEKLAKSKTKTLWNFINDKKGHGNGA